MSKEWVVRAEVKDEFGVKHPWVVYQGRSYILALFIFAATYVKLVLGTMKARLSEHK